MLSSMEFCGHGFLLLEAGCSVYTPDRSVHEAKVVRVDPSDRPLRNTTNSIPFNSRVNCFCVWLSFIGNHWYSSSSTISAIARELVNPGLSMPKRLTKPVNPSSFWMMKSTNPLPDATALALPNLGRIPA
jgi:hypothetical protein